MKIQDGKTVWLLSTSYEDGDRENCMIFDTPRAMAVGLAQCVVDDHPELQDRPGELAALAASLVFDLFYEGPGESEECRDGNTVYGYDTQNIKWIELDKGDAQ